MAINYELINKGGISLGTNFELLSEKPLDSRLVVPSLDGLQNYIDSAAAYEGMIAYVSSEKKHYEVKVIDGVLSYRPFGLTEAELNDLITNATTAAMEFKGATSTIPENPAKGDMYKVAGENINIKIDDVDAKLGDSIVYDGEKWFLIPSGDDIEDTWRPVDGVNNDATLKFVDGDKTVASVAADGTIKYNHATVAAPADVTAEGDEKTRTYITAVETDGYGHITGYKTATENVEDTNTTYEFEGQAEESSVYFQVTASEEGAAAEVVYLDAYSKNEADGKFVAKEAGKSLVSDDEIARLAEVDNYDDEEVRGLINAIDNHSHENKTVLDGITAAKVADWDDAVTKEHTHTFADSDVEDAITKKHSHTFTDADVEDAISKEHTHNFSDETALNGITAAKVADWDDAVSKEHTHSFVDSDVEDAITKKHAHTFADEDVEDAISKKHTHTFVEAELNKIADGDVAKWNTAASKADDNAQAVEDLGGYVGTFTHATAKTVVEYINAKTDGIATSGNLEALGTRVTAVEGDVATIKGDYLKAADITDFETKNNVKKVADDLAAYVESNDAAIAAETKARTDADAGFETRIAALEDNFGDGEGTVEAQIEAAVQVVQDAVDAIEADYVKSADISNFETKENVKKVSDELGAYKASNDAALAEVKATAEAARTEDEVNSQIDAKIGALNLATTYEPIGAEDRAKQYVDGKFTDANLGQYTTEDEVKSIVDGVIKTATSKETLDSLVELVEYIDTHSGDAINMATAIGVLEGKVEGIEEKPAYDITATQISNWDNEVGAKALAGTKLDASTFTEYSNAHASDYTNKQIDDAIDADVKAAVDAEVIRANGAYDTKGAAADAQTAAEATAAGALASARTEITTEIGTAISGEVSRADGKYEEKGVAQGIVDGLKLSETYEPIGAESRAVAAAEGKVNALAGNVYTKSETYTKAEVEAMFTWGSF